MTSRFSSSAAALMVLTACASPAPTGEAITIDVPFHTVRSTAVASTRSVAGSVRARTVSHVSARIAGDVTRVHVSIGDHVRRGQPLVEIDDRDGRAGATRAAAGRNELEQAIAAASAATESARASAALASDTFARFSSLKERGSASVQEFDDARARHAVAQAELQRAQRTHAALMARQGEAAALTAQAATVLAHSTVRSPIDGIVTARSVDPGSSAAPGAPLITVEDAVSFRVDAMIDESLAVRAGDSVIVESGNRRFAARVTRAGPAVDAVTRSAPVEIEIPEPLRAGGFVNVIFTTGQRSAITVPADAISRRGQLTSVFAVEDGVARMRLVQLGDTVGDITEVLAGLDDGEIIIPVSLAGLRDGMRVRRSR